MYTSPNLRPRRLCSGGRLPVAVSVWSETSQASTPPAGVLSQGDGGEDEDSNLAGCRLDLHTA